MNTIIKFVFLLIVISFFSCEDQNTSQEEIKQSAHITVGVYDGNGAGTISVIETIEALKIDSLITAFPISASDISQGKLKEIDALVFPGGSGSKQLNNLGKEGKKQVLDFVKKDGKGILGICAGAYMSCSTEGYVSLQLGNVKHIDRAHYARGRGLVKFKLNEKGLEIFPELLNKNQFLQYYDGPVMKPLGTSETFRELGYYVTDIHSNKGAPIGITPGNTFIYNEKVGDGKIFAIAGHPESTPGMRWMVPRMIRWITGNELISYSSKWIDPNKNNKPILFTDSLKKYEKKLWWQLFNDTTRVQIKAMDDLYALRSRPAVRWNIGLLRDTNAKTREHAAKLIAKTEYTYALKDLKAAFQKETDSLTKKALKDAIVFLEK